MKYYPSYDGIPRADFPIKLRLTKQEVERLRYSLKKKGKRALDTDVRNFVSEMCSWIIIENEVMSFLKDGESE